MLQNNIETYFASGKKKENNTSSSVIVIMASNVYKQNQFLVIRLKAKA